MSLTQRLMKLLTLACLTSAFVGVSVAQASGPTWKLDNEALTESLELNTEGALQFKTAGIEVNCEAVQLEGVINNPVDVYQNNITGGALGEADPGQNGLCKTDRPSCPAEVVLENAPWYMSFPGEQLRLSEPWIKVKLMGGVAECQVPLPNLEFRMKGSLTTTELMQGNELGGVILGYVDEGGLTAEFLKISPPYNIHPVKVSGEVLLRSAEGGELSLEF